MGIEHAAISPPGSSDEEPGGSSQFAKEIRELAAGQGKSPGDLMSMIAQLHEGSHEGCDAALAGGGNGDSGGTVAGPVRASAPSAPAGFGFRRGPRLD
jgi:hypothetical protein